MRVQECKVSQVQGYTNNFETCTLICMQMKMKKCILQEKQMPISGNHKTPHNSKIQVQYIIYLLYFSPLIAQLFFKNLISINWLQFGEQLPIFFIVQIGNLCNYLSNYSSY